jgi:glycosyltransferase involved in cell wall biosynthesis
MPVPLILVSNKTKSLECYRQELAANTTPRIDYIEIAQRLGGEFFGPDRSKGVWYHRVLELEERLRLGILEALFAASHFSRYSVFLSTSEKTAIPLSVFISLIPRKKPHVLIGHRLSSNNKKRFFRIWHLRKNIAHIICLCQSQADFAIQQLNFPASRVSFIYDKVDQKFFSPAAHSSGDYLLAVGQEQRDYETLFKAISGTEIPLVVVASSPWSTFNVKIQNPKNVTILTHIPFIQLRDLYASARLVVAPLFNVDYAAGANGVLEAMSMGKPVILSHSDGIRDYAVDGETGRYSTPGDAVELREKILELWDAPAEQRRLGTNARQAVEESMNLDIYIDKVVEIIASTLL